ncbi:diguanylate cyclase (GGDEF) domain-containing protein [Noviherbaspirillum humi]|uniref:diguanylate cyclase n=1 Tax=Noviherbaspirillum humi TaxID=1688639 RepID=A0A239CJT4_9BURK|nr:sensor domain-containing diguanylate cyclase [Noviherbaspirillum humi]SNS20199.1 diguanylate cyclase (GGDEF) domain-containing protein [Noviherbaspirillum humi]
MFLRKKRPFSPADAPASANEAADDSRHVRRQLESLIEQARRNQEIMRRHQQLDIAFISAAGFLDLARSLFELLPASSELDVVTLFMLDADYGIRRMLADLHIDAARLPHLIFIDDESELGEISVELDRPLLGAYKAELHGRLFPEPAPAPASVAIMPLLRHGRLIGCLNLGSFDASRFHGSMATDFIEHRASIVAICLENVLNQERLKHIGLTDPLTGISNRRYIERRLLEEIGRSRRQEYALSCMYIDIDHFKQINDRHGHAAGDEVLREVAGRIKAELRLSDALGRFGGEEFVVVLVDAGLADARGVAERIRTSIADHPLLLSGQTRMNVTASIGVATLVNQVRAEAPQSAAERLIARADAALYQAKQGGRNRVVEAA